MRRERRHDCMSNVTFLTVIYLEETVIKWERVVIPRCCASSGAVLLFFLFCHLCIEQFFPGVIIQIRCESM